jgi:chemotaxis protein MotB
MQRPPLIRRKHEEPEDEGWLITFADMSVLLMCFFVILFALSTPNEKQMQVIAEALRKEGFYNDVVPTQDPFEKLKNDLRLTIGASGYDQMMFATATPESINLELASGAFFVPGSAKFTPQALPMLGMISNQINALATAEIQIEVEGHTDDTPVTTEQFPSNWELSSARAANVVRYLIAKGFPPEKLRAIGVAATRPKAPNVDAEGNVLEANREINRRIVVRMVRGEDRL